MPCRRRFCRPRSPPASWSCCWASSATIGCSAAPALRLHRRAAAHRPSRGGRDEAAGRPGRAGPRGLSRAMPSRAVREYKVALARAYERDDAGAIADVAYNLALAQMKAGDSKAALATVRDARAELDRRHVQIPAELFLVQAAAAYRNGDLGTAAAAAQDALDRPAEGPHNVPTA